MRIGKFVTIRFKLQGSRNRLHGDEDSGKHSEFWQTGVMSEAADTGRGLMSVRRIQQGEVIVQIPHTLLITATTVLECDVGEHIERWKPKLCLQQALCVFIMNEKSLGVKSKWHPYIAALPDTFSTPAYFSDSDLRLLPRRVHEKASEQIVDLHKYYEDIRNYCTDNWTSKLNIFTQENFRWSWYVANTRSVYMQQTSSSYLSTNKDKNMALAPFLDLLNHSPTAEVRILFEKLMDEDLGCLVFMDGLYFIAMSVHGCFPVIAGYNSTSKCFEIKTLNEYKKYDQVFISYGPHDNSKLLLEYGFTIPGNPHNCFEFDHGCLEDLRSNFNIDYWDKKIDICTQNSLINSKLTCSDEGLSWKLQTTLRILSLNWLELQNCKPALYGCPVSDRSEAIVSNMATHLIQKELRETQAILESLEHQELSHHAWLAVSLHHDDMVILSKCNDELRKQMT